MSDDQDHRGDAAGDAADDALRRRLAALDPVPSTTPVDPAQGPRARELMERIMTTTDDPTSTDDRPGPAAGGTSRRRGLLAAAAAAVLLAGGLTYALTDGARTSGTPVTAQGPALTLTVAADDPTASCLRLDATGLAQFPLAFAGTVTAVQDGTVTVDVTRWYRGGTAGTVELQGTGGSPALTGVELAAGEDVLMTAAGGQVTSCGYSGPVSPELQALYDQAFGG